MALQHGVVDSVRLVGHVGQVRQEAAQGTACEVFKLQATQVAKLSKALVGNACWTGCHAAALQSR